MSKEIRTTTESLLIPYASLAMKEAAEKVIKDHAACFTEVVSKMVYAEVEKTALKYAEIMTKNLDKELHIIIEDRRSL